MSSFVFWVTAYCVIELVCKIVCLSLGMVPERTRGGMLLDALIGLGLVIWGVRVLA